MLLLIIIVIVIIIIAFFVYQYYSRENFTDIEKSRNSKIIYSKLKTNKNIDFDTYKDKLRDYPELLDVTIYDKIKNIPFNVNSIYNIL